MKYNWKYGILEDAVNKGSSNISLNKIKDDDGDYPVFGAKGFAQNVSFYQQESEYLGIIKDGAGIGRVSRHPEKSSILATMQYILPKKGFDIQFINYFLDYIDFEKYRTGSTIPHIYYKDYKSEPFPLVNIDEQKRIVAKLDECFSLIDNCQLKIENSLRNAKELFQSQLNQIFASTGSATDGDSPELAEGWVEKKLGDITTILGDGLHGTPKYTIDGEYYFINGNNLDNGKIIYKNRTKRASFGEYEKYKKNLNDRTVFVSINGTLGNVAFYNNEKVILGKSACYFNLTEQADKNFIKYVILSPYFIDYAHKVATGATIKNVSLKSMRELKINLPKIEEQKEIVILLDTLQSQTQSLESNYQQELEALDELKKSILQKAFRGELTIDNG